MITLQDVTYTYPGGASPALSQVSLSIPQGQFCGVIGRNGAGKSTLAYALGGFIPHFYHGTLRGEISVDGRQTALTPLNELVCTTGLVFQNPFNQISGTKFSVREEIAFGLENLGVRRDEMQARIEAVLEEMGIAELAERSPLSLSGGQMQRVAIASILVMRPKVLVLDEPTSQLDPVGSREVFGAIRRLSEAAQVTVIMVEHKLEWLASFADRIVALADGRVVADGEPPEVLTGEAAFRHGIGFTRYTLASKRAQEAGYWPQGRRLAVTLEEAARGFRQD